MGQAGLIFTSNRIKVSAFRSRMENDMEIYHYTNIFWLDKILASKHLVPTNSFPSIPKLVWLTEEEDPPGTATVTDQKCFRFLFDTSHPDIVPWPDYAKTIETAPSENADS